MKRANTTSPAKLIDALAQGHYSGPRGDLSFKGKHYVSLTMFITSYNGTKGTVVGKYRRMVPQPVNKACQ
jgi:hypothetical protein